MRAEPCADDVGCPVPVPPGPADTRRLRTTVWPQDRPFFHVHGHQHGCDAFNPGHGDTRFAPLDEGGHPVPTLYGGGDETVALLESVLHDVGASPPGATRVVYEAMLRGRGLAHLLAPRDLVLLDLRDEALARLGLERPQLVTTAAAHYACTRRWGAWLRGRRPGGRVPDGFVWHSRQAEVVPGRGPSGAGDEVFLLWGDRAPSASGAYALVGPGVRNLVEGPGRVLVEELAERLGAVVEPG